MWTRFSWLAILIAACVVVMFLSYQSLSNLTLHKRPPPLRFVPLVLPPRVTPSPSPSSSQESLPLRMQSSADQSDGKNRHSEVRRKAVRVKRMQSYYEAFTGEFWLEYPGARAVLEEYMNKAGRKRDNPGDTSQIIGAVEYAPSAEMCNQLMGLVSSFALAITLNKYFGVPQRSFPSWYPDVFDPNHDRYNWFLSQVPEIRASQGTRVVKNTDVPVSSLLCDNYVNIFPRQQNVFFHCNQYYLPLLQQNPHFQHIFDKIGEDPFRPLARFIMKPHKYVADKVDAFVKENFLGKYVIGIHLRAGGGWPATEDQWKVFWDAATFAEQGNVEGLPVVWFLAADMDKPREDAKRKFGDKILLFPSVFGTKDLGELYRFAFAEVLLLAECDDLVTTSWSTYSYAAAGLAGIRPIIVTEERKPQAISKQKGGETIKWAGLDLWANNRTVFSRLPTTQPCFHFYFDWRVQDATCFSGKHVDHEMMDGTRYC